MEGIGAAIGDSIAALLDQPIVGTILRLAAAYVVLVWLAGALWAFFDLRRRTSNPIAPYVSAAFVILASPLLFAFALVIHRVLRPADFTPERRLVGLQDRALELEASGPRCPECRRPVDDAWLLCPSCRRTLGHRCHACGATVGLDWLVCGWCAAELDGARQTEVRVRA